MVISAATLFDKRFIFTAVRDYNPLPVIEKMDKIQSVFRTVQESVLPLTDFKQVAECLNGLSEEFTSVAYEAASMKIALGALKRSGSNQLEQWNLFLKEFGSLHGTQIHIGFGWALAQEQLNPIERLYHFAPFHRYRIIDGFGYYEGFFRRRKSVLNKEQLKTDDEMALTAYDQGLGRSLWYSNKANIAIIAEIIRSFSDERQKSLWRGLGIATAYVGGCDEPLLYNLKHLSGNYFRHFSVGVAMSCISRVKANAVTDDSENMLMSLCGETFDSLMKIEAEFHFRYQANEHKIFQHWLDFLTDSLNV